MKTILIRRAIRPLALAAVLNLSVGCACQVMDRSSGKEVENMKVEAACGQCQFGLPGDACDLAVRIDGKAYFVDGTHIDDHGDAHAADGFCNAVRMAEVTGRVEGDRFVAESFRLIPEDE